MIIFGLTGGIASGKSTVTKTFIKHGIPLVDADIVAREVVTVGSHGWGFVRAMFGQEYFNEDETINRTKLGALVFSDKQAMYNLNHVMKPLIQIESARQITALHSAGNSIVGYNAALICEMGNAKKYHPLIVVACSKDIQKERLMKRNDLTEEQALARINAQMSVEEKIKLADHVIDTSKEIEFSIQQTETIIHQLKTLHAADVLAKAAHGMFGPTKNKTGNEYDDLDSALSEYWKVRKYIKA